MPPSGPRNRARVLRANRPAYRRRQRNLRKLDRPPSLISPITPRGRRNVPRPVRITRRNRIRPVGPRPRVVSKAVPRHQRRPVTPRQVHRRQARRQRKLHRREQRAFAAATRRIYARQQQLLREGLNPKYGYRLAAREVLDPSSRREHHTFINATKPQSGDPVEGFLAGSVRRPVLKVGVFALEQTTRPLHGIAGASYAAFKGENVLRAAGRGFANKDRRTFSDVLAAAGVKNKTIRGIAGFGLDVGLDPTTYLTLGASAPAKAAARAATRKVEREAIHAARRAGASPAEAQNAARVARALHRRSLPANRGISIGARALGREVKTSGRATAAVSRRTGFSKAAARTRESRPVQTGGQLLRPDFKPKGVAERDWRRIRRAERTTRATQHAGHRAAQDRAVAYHRALRGKDHPRIVHAIETGNLAALKGDEREVAEAIVRDLSNVHGAELRAGLVGNRLSNYFPHKIHEKLLPGRGKKLPAGKRAELESSKQRKYRQPISELERDPALKGVFSQDIPLTVGARLTQSATARANAHLINELNATGKPFGLGAKRAEGEAVFEVFKRRPPRKLAGDELKRLYDQIRAKGVRDAFEGRDFKVLNEQLVNHATRMQFPAHGAMRSFGRWFDRAAQGRFKTLVTVPNPQYHLTNLYGDLFNAYLGDTRFLTGTAGVHSARALGRLARREKARRTLANRLDPTRKGLRVRGKRIGYDQLLDEAEQVGVIRTGFIGRDLPEILESQAKELAERVGKGGFARRIPGAGRVVASRPGRVVAHPIDTMRTVGQYREDLVRLATYIEARKRGMPPGKASEWVAKHHFDYGDLTDFERTVLRRIFPFYTFTARNTPLQVEKLLTRPGKYANLEKLREEAQKSSDLPPGFERNLTDYQQRGQPIAIPGTSTFLSPKLPSTDLGRLAPDLQEQFQYTFQMLSPFIGVPLELGSGQSFFFREPIDELAQQSGGEVQDYAAAPAWFADSVKAVLGEKGLRAFGIHKAPLRKGEKRQFWVWPKKWNYLYGHLGPAAGTAQRLGSGENQVGQGANEALLNFLTGLKVAPYDRKRIRENRLWDRRDTLDARARLLRREGRDRHRDGSYTREYRQVLDGLNVLNKRLFGNRRKAGGASVLDSLHGGGDGRGELLDALHGG